MISFILFIFFSFFISSDFFISFSFLISSTTFFFFSFLFSFPFFISSNFSASLSFFISSNFFVSFSPFIFSNFSVSFSVFTSSNFLISSFSFSVFEIFSKFLFEISLSLLSSNFTLFLLLFKISFFKIPPALFLFPLSISNNMFFSIFNSKKFILYELLLWSFIAVKSSFFTFCGCKFLSAFLCIVLILFLCRWNSSGFFKSL